MGRLLQTPYRVDEDSCVHQSDVSLPRTTTGTRPRRRARGSATTPRTAVMELYRPMLATASAAPSAVRPRAAGSGGRVRGSGVVRHRGHRGVRGAPVRLPPRAPRTDRPAAVGGADRRGRG